MLRLLHRLLTRNRITRRLQRALVHRVKELVGFRRAAIRSAVSTLNPAQLRT